MTIKVRAAVSGLVFTGCAAALSGCGANANSAARGVSAAGSLGAISGRTFGGQQPVSGAHVYVYGTGTGGYAGASTSLLTSSNGTGSDGNGYYVTTDANGGFQIASAVACAAGTQAYLYATGGDPGFGTNSAVGLLAPLGACSSTTVSPPVSFVQINEVSTIVTAYALAGFAVDPTHISTSGSSLAATGVANAMLNALNILDLATGTVPATSATGNAVVPTAKIYTLANALASCINSAGPGSSNCQSVYTDTGTSSDMATAAMAIAHAPYTHVGDLYTLGASSSAPFSPYLSSAPADFTLGLQYQTPTYTANQTAGTTSFANNYSAAFDSGGNLWTRATNDKDTTSTVNSVTTLVKYGPTGSVLNTITLSGNSNSENPYIHLGIDSADNVWSGLEGGVLEYSSAGALLSPAAGYTCTGMGTLTSTVFASNGMVYAGDFGASKIWELSSGGACEGTVTAASAAFTGYLAIEKTGDVISSGSLSSGNSYVFRFVPGGTGYSGFTSGGDYISTDNAGQVWAFSTIGGSAFDVLNEYATDGTGLAPTSGYSGGGFAQSNTVDTRAGQEGVHVDGAGAVWVGVAVCTTGGSSGCTRQPDIIAGLTNSGAAITPATGLVLPNGETGAHALAPDGSGNLWVAVTDGSLIEYVGLTTPVATPILYNQLGVKP